MILISLALMAWMIFTLVKNAIIGVQLSHKDEYNESLEVIVPVVSEDFFQVDLWIKKIQSFRKLNANNLRIHFLIDKHHPSTNELQGLEREISLIEVHTFTILPENIETIPWMISQIADQVRGKNIIIGDPEILPSEEGLISMAYNCDKFERPILVLPQIAKTNFSGEALETLNPSLALISFMTLRKKMTHYFYPLLQISRFWIVMNLNQFKEISWDKLTSSNWKEHLSFSDSKSKSWLKLAFGEKHLIRSYPTQFNDHLKKLFQSYEQFWQRPNKNGLFLFLIFQFIWFIPIGFIGVFPLWTILGILLLVIYRFFTKIIFQESWIAVLFHPLSNFLHLFAILKPILKKFFVKKNQTHL